MLLGLPWTAWLLIALAILPCLALILRFYAVHRRDHLPPTDPARK